MQVRSAHPEDADALAAIMSDWIDETDWMPRLHSREGDRKFLARLIHEQDVQVLCDRVPVGFLARLEDEIDALYLTKVHRRRGGGTMLLTAAQTARDHLVLWTFQANAPARSFYAKAGFVEVKQTDGSGNDEGLPDVRLEWWRHNDG